MSEPKWRTTAQERMNQFHAGWCAARAGEPADAFQSSPWLEGHALYLSPLVQAELGSPITRTSHSLETSS